MLAAVLLAGAMLEPCEAPESPALGVVCPYLQALQRLDHKAMAVRWAPTVISVFADGDTSEVQPEAARDMRDFERETHTRWTFAVDSARGDSVFVTLTEANDFYDLLGVGPRTQTELYVVSTGRISRMETLTSAHSGGEFRPVYRAFAEWLLSTAAASDPELVQDGRLRFTAASAKKMHPWLEAWHRQQGGKRAR